MNLLSNALKFTFKGHIGIKLSMHDDPEGGEAPKPKKSEKYVEKRLDMEVQDSGYGIKPEDLKKLFKCFGKLQDS